MMFAEISDDKFRLSYKITTDNARRVRHIRENRFGIVCHGFALVPTSMLFTFEFETQCHATSVSTLKLMQNAYSPVSQIYL